MARRGESVRVVVVVVVVWKRLHGECLVASKE
jgi:hypothetical protein